MLNKLTSSTRTFGSITALISVLTLTVVAIPSSADQELPGPGTPDAIQLEHYEELKTAIEARERINALAALALFEGDIYRWHTNTLTLAVAFTELLQLTDAVDEQNWEEANTLLIELKNRYRPE